MRLGNPRPWTRRSKADRKAWEDPDWFVQSAPRLSATNHFHQLVVGYLNDLWIARRSLRGWHHKATAALVSIKDQMPDADESISQHLRSTQHANEA